MTPTTELSAVTDGSMTCTRIDGPIHGNAYLPTQITVTFKLYDHPGYELSLKLPLEFKRMFAVGEEYTFAIASKENDDGR